MSKFKLNENDCSSNGMPILYELLVNKINDSSNTDDSNSYKISNSKIEEMRVKFNKLNLVSIVCVCICFGF